jgi:hypothetical protein
MPENQPAPVALDINPVQGQRVEMRVEIQWFRYERSMRVCDRKTPGGLTGNASTVARDNSARIAGLAVRSVAASWPQEVYRHGLGW